MILKRRIATSSDTEFARISHHEACGAAQSLVSRLGQLLLLGPGQGSLSQRELSRR